MGKSFTEKNLSKVVEVLQDTLKAVTGLNHVTLDIAIDLDRVGDEVISIESNDLVDYQYPKMFSSLKLVNFGGGWSKDENDKPVYWLPVDYRYFHFGGGSNGSKVINFYLSPGLEILSSESKLQ